jgi:hypothetical protein
MNVKLLALALASLYYASGAPTEMMRRESGCTSYSVYYPSLDAAPKSYLS